MKAIEQYFQVVLFVFDNFAKFLLSFELSTGLRPRKEALHKAANFRSVLEGSLSVHINRLHSSFEKKTALHKVSTISWGC